MKRNGWIIPAFDRPCYRRGWFLPYLLGAGLILLQAIQQISLAETDYVAVTVREGQLLRDIAAEYLDDPDLWPEILDSSGLDSPAAVYPGVALKIPRTKITTAGEALRQSLDSIQRATAVGARVFYPALINKAIGQRDRALDEKRQRRWEQATELARLSKAAADEAYRLTVEERDTSAQAILSNGDGRVQARRPAELGWRGSDIGDVLIEQERLRTLSESYAEVLFVDESQLRLGANSLAVIQKMRMDLLNNRQEASVNLVEGDVLALLGSSPTAPTLDVAVPGVTTSRGSSEFWMSRRGSTTKVANYDDSRMLVAAAGGEVTLNRSQGTVIGQSEQPSPARDLLPAPMPLLPEDDFVADVDQVALQWRDVADAQSYNIEVATDSNFRRLLTSQTNITNNGRKLENLPEGEYYWRVAAIDKLGFPGTKSTRRRFFVRPDQEAPYLSVLEPQEQSILRVSPGQVSGVTEPDVSLRLNGRAVEPADDGSFSASLDLEVGLNTAVLDAEDASGNRTSRTRTLIYMPDQPALVEYVDAPDVTGLVRVGNREFVSRDFRFLLAGRTIPQALVQVASDVDGTLARTTADAEGTFRVRLSIKRDLENYRLEVTSPSGYVTEDSFTVTRDALAPELTITPEPPSLMRKAILRLHGQVTGATEVVINSDPVELSEGIFDIELQLESGPNVVDVIARDLVGNESRWQRTVFLDRDPPKLLDHQVTVRPGSQGKTLELSVRAEDASGLKRVAYYSLRLGSETLNGTLLLDPLTQTYRGLATLESAPSARAQLDSLVLEDYSGNRQVYRF